MNEKIIKEYIRACEHIIGYFRDVLEEENKIIPPPDDPLKELTNLRMLSKTEAWPEAVPTDLICGESEDAKLARATGIIQEYVTSDVENKKFLDFGCGEGHVAYVVASLFKPKFATGYDVKEHPWNHGKNREYNNFSLTTDWELVLKNGPYDVILVNDVIDHSSDPVKALQQIRNAKGPDGKIFMRCHPWSSRHGTHLYKQLNKAYLHLVFTKDELFSMGLKEMATQPALDPLVFYRLLLQNAGFSVLKEETVTHPVEMFFTHTPDILRRIKDKWKTSSTLELADGTTFPREIMEIQFVDYVLI